MTASNLSISTLRVCVGRPTLVLNRLNERERQLPMPMETLSRHERRQNAAFVFVNRPAKDGETERLMMITANGVGMLIAVGMCSPADHHHRVLILSNRSRCGRTEKKEKMWMNCKRCHRLGPPVASGDSIALSE